MKKALFILMPLLLCLSIPSACSGHSADSNAQNMETKEESACSAAKNDIDFRLVGDDLNKFEAAQISRESIDEFQAAEMEGNYLFSAHSFEAVLDQAEDLKSAIYAGNLVAVFEASGIDQPFEKDLNLPIQFPQSGDLDRLDDYVTVARMYKVGQDGALVAAEVAVPTDIAEENSYAYFMECAADFSGKEDRPCLTNASGSGRLGSAEKYFAGRHDRGSLEVIYDMYFEENADGNDYYMYHAYIEASPIGTKYKLGSLTTKVGVYGASIIYPPQPNSTNNSLSYTISAVPVSLQNHLTYLPNFSWTLTKSDVDITRYRDHESTYCWDIDFARSYNGDVLIQPGGTIAVPTGKRFTIHTDHTMSMRSYSGDEVDGTFFFICDPSGVNYA